MLKKIAARVPPGAERLSVLRRGARWSSNAHAPSAELEMSLTEQVIETEIF
jgi:hypothetical protein